MLKNDPQPCPCSQSSWYLVDICEMLWGFKEQHMWSPWHGALHTVSTMVIATSFVCPSIHPSSSDLSKAALSKRTFCHNTHSVSALCMWPASHLRLLSTCSVTSVTEELSFSFNFFFQMFLWIFLKSFLINLNSFLWLLATILDSIVLKPKHSHVTSWCQVFPSL